MTYEEAKHEALDDVLFLLEVWRERAITDVNDPEVAKYIAAAPDEVRPVITETIKASDAAAQQAIDACLKIVRAVKAKLPRRPNRAAVRAGTSHEQA
jgi:hypothetical protein